MAGTEYCRLMEINGGNKIPFIKIVDVEKVIVVKPEIRPRKWESYVSSAKSSKKIVYESVDEFLMK